MGFSPWNRWGVRGVAVAAVICAAALAPRVASGAITTNPADRPVLLSEPIEELQYDFGRSCLSHPQPGTLALEEWLQRNWPGVSWGIMRCEKLGPHNFSLHSEGRAIDWHLDAHNPAQRAEAMRLINLFLAPDKDGNPFALARRMGIQGLIFNCRAWWGGPGLVP